ncbi:MAG: thioredoxin family protein [candidate division KSB1 bacterium]|nr:thioredoxin family protein [candidate division KSB1 bacterium]MDZ7375070.1 thioredoxin family protein [candidate division KSB1 bacterium]MDZ7400057.1 thioredoxin family protein [candidate division KSB1 bacterium]
MTGELTAQQLLDNLAAYRSGKVAYQPDPEALSALRSLGSDIQILVFLGTWCPDSEREVPRFLKIMELTKGGPISYQLIGLDRSKRDAFGLAEKYQIEFVPTFVVIQQDEEIGRIVESATVSLEQDLLEIIESGIGKK